MFEKYTQPARRTVFFARYEASQFGSAYIETEHLLLGIIREDAALLLRLLGSREKVEALRGQIEKHCPRAESSSTSVDLPLSAESKHVLRQAAEEAKQNGQDQIGPAHLLLGIALEEASSGARILRENGIIVSALRAKVAQSGVAETVLASEPAVEPTSESVLEAAPKPWLKSGLLLRNLTQAAGSGALGPLIGRERELERIIQILSRRTRNYPLLVGEHGVGKTTIVEGLAQRIADGNLPTLAERSVFAVDADTLVAPSRRARFGEGLESPLAQIIAWPVGILCVEGLLDLAASPDWGAVEATHVLEVLSRSGIQCIATGTPAGLRHAVENTATVVHHFEVVDIAPATEEESLGILSGIKERFEKFHDVVFADGVMEAAVFASGRFLTHRFLPDRAIDLIDEAGAIAKVRQEINPPDELELRKRIQRSAENVASALANHEFAKAQEYSNQERVEREKLRQMQEDRKLSGPAQNVVTPSDIEEAVAARAGVPVSAVRELLQQKKGKELQVVMRELAGGISVERCPWLPFLAAYLVSCPAEEAEKLAQAIRAAKA